MTKFFYNNSCNLIYHHQNNEIENTHNPNYINEEIPPNLIQQLNENNIYDYEVDNLSSKPPLKQSEIFICPECKRECLINDNKYNIRIICDYCGFQSNYSPLDFEQSQYRNVIYINCDSCYKRISEDDCFYCLNSKLNLCQDCKYNYYQNFCHSIIPFTEKNSYCLEHGEKFNSYCHKCKKNCCMQCKIDDKKEAHIKEGFDLNAKKIKKNLENIIERYEAFKKKVNYDFLYVFNSLIPKEAILNFSRKLMNKIDIAFNLYYDIISSYGKIRSRKHLMNQKQFNMDCFNNDFIKIIEEKDSIKSIQYFIELCKEVTHTNSATLIYGVNENNLIDDNYFEMKIFGKEFAKQNKDNCRINYKKIKSKLKEYFKIKKEDLKDNRVSFQFEIIENSIKNFEYFCDGTNFVASPDIDKILVKERINNFKEAIPKFVNVEGNKEQLKINLEKIKYPQNIYYNHSNYRIMKIEEYSITPPINPIRNNICEATQNNTSACFDDEIDEREKQCGNQNFYDEINKEYDKVEAFEHESIKESNSKFSCSNYRKENYYTTKDFLIDESSITKDIKTIIEQTSYDDIENLEQDIKKNCRKSTPIILEKIELNYASKSKYYFGKIKNIITYIWNNFSFESIPNIFGEIWNDCKELFNNIKNEFLNLIKKEFSNFDSWYNVRYNPGNLIRKGNIQNETPITHNNNSIIMRNREVFEAKNISSKIKLVKEESPPFLIKEFIGNNTAPKIINIISVRCKYNLIELLNFIFLNILTSHNPKRMLFNHNGIKFHLCLISCNYGNKMVFISFLTNCVLLFYMKRQKCLIKLNFPYGYLFANNKFGIGINNNLIPLK